MRHLVCLAAIVCLSIDAVNCRAQETAVIGAQRVMEVDPHKHPEGKLPVITAVAVRPGGEIVATGGDDHVVRLWSTSSGGLLMSLAGHGDWVRSLAFSPDGETLVSASDDRKLILWQVATGQPVGRMAAHDQAVYSVAWSGDGRWIAAAGFAEQVSVFDASTRELAFVLAGPCRDLRSVVFSPDSESLAVAGRNGQIRVWSLASREVQFNIDSGAGRIRSLEYLPGGDKLVSASENRAISLWDARTGEAAGRLNCDKGKLLSMVVCGERLIATGCTDNIVRVWNWQTQTEVDKLVGHTGSVAALAYDRASETIISGSFDTTVRVWRVGSTTSDQASTATETETLTR